MERGGSTEEGRFRATCQPAVHKLCLKWIPSLSVVDDPIHVSDTTAPSHLKPLLDGEL